MALHPVKVQFLTSRLVKYPCQLILREQMDVLRVIVWLGRDSHHYILSCHPHSCRCGFLHFRDMFQYFKHRNDIEAVIGKG